MPLYKRRALRKLVRKAKRVKRAPMPMRRITASRSNVTTHSFSRKTALSSIVGNVAYSPYQSFTGIRLSYLTNASEFGALYDQYRINWVKVQFWLRIDPSAQTAAAASQPKLYWFRDQDDQILASQSEMRERSNLKIAVLRTDRPVTIWIKPNVLSETFRGTATTSYSPKFGQWLDMTTNDVEHYGIKYNIDFLTNTNYVVDVESTYYFQCKNTR